MQNITEMELQGYSQLLTHEQNAIQKFKSYAESCPEVKETGCIWPLHSRTRGTYCFSTSLPTMWM